MRVLVIAPHPDDEVLGVGGAMRRLSIRGHEVTVAIVTKGWAPLFPDSQVVQVRSEAQAANAHLGIRDLVFLDLPVTRLHLMPEHELNAAFANLVAEKKPDWVFVPFSADRHEDHRQIFDAMMVALRPLPGRPVVERIAAYETVSETHWSAPGLEASFAPNWFVDISEHLGAKLEAMQLYASQVRPKPDARSLSAIESLARWRGSVVGVEAAEAFQLIRQTESP